MAAVAIALLLLAGPAWAEMEIGFANPDGSQDTYNTATGEFEMGF